jgi:hypothetical protein
VDITEASRLLKKKFQFNAKAGQNLTGFFVSQSLPTKA